MQSNRVRYGIILLERMFGDDIMVRRIDIYKDSQADRVAEQFFHYNYRDRGMLKWQGYFLSDHTAALKRHRAYLKKQFHRQYFPQQTPAIISQKIASAWHHHKMVTIVLNLVGNDRQHQKFTGKITGYYGSKVVISDRTNNSHLIAFSDIRNVQYHTQHLKQ